MIWAFVTTLAAFDSAAKDVPSQGRGVGVVVLRMSGVSGTACFRALRLPKGSVSEIIETAGRSTKGFADTSLRSGTRYTGTHELSIEIRVGKR